MPKEKNPRTADIARQIAQPVAQDLGLTIWDIRFEKEGANWYLRYFIDKPGGVGIQDCEAFSRAVDPLLDQADPIEQSYILEVSSPGIERTLTRPEHFELYTGKKIRIRLIRPSDGQRDFVGELVERGQDGALTLQTQDGPMTFPKAEIAAVKTHVDIDFGGKP